MRIVFKYIFSILIVNSIFVSCKNDIGLNDGLKPPALGVLNEIVVIADDKLYDGPIGDTLRYYFESAYPLMPAPESMFDLRHFTPEELDNQPLRKELRTYLVVANLSDTESSTTKMVRSDLGENRYLKVKEGNDVTTLVGKDKWAQGQMLFYIFANDPSNLEKAIAENFNSIATKVNKFDESIIEGNIYAVRHVNKGLSEKILNEFGIEMKVPNDYNMVVDKPEDHFMWLKKDAKDAVMGIAIQSVKYRNQSQLNLDSLIAFRNEYGKKYISSDKKGSYMVTNDEDLPIMSYDVEIDGHYAKEIRGIWEMENDFKGGPYFCYAIPLPEQDRLVYIDVLVLRQGKDKRNLMQQLDYIVKNIKILSTKTN
ncbi:MAG TPA: DUF4837 family protein [Saprospiraceae bacterium]|nr:DUF4837 family protein [Saprospiraceae bacterium]